MVEHVPHELETVVDSTQDHVNKTAPSSNGRTFGFQPKNMSSILIGSSFIFVLLGKIRVNKILLKKLL